VGCCFLGFVFFFSPFNNPTETYRYYSLPFCQSHASQEEEDKAADEENISLDMIRREEEKREAAIRHRHRFGESIVGDRRETSPYEITFGDSVDWRLLCQTTLGKNDLDKFRKAIQNNYFFEMFVEDLPMWGYVGDIVESDFIVDEVEGTSRSYLFPHLHFTLGYNKHRIVSAKVTTDVRILFMFQIKLFHYHHSSILIQISSFLTSYNTLKIKQDGSSRRYHQGRKSIGCSVLIFSGMGGRRA
jgi:hypothetical protein